MNLKKFIFNDLIKLYIYKISNMFNQNNMSMPMMQFPVHNQNEIKRDEIIRPYKEIIKQLEKENKELKDENDQLKMQLNQYQMNSMGNMGMMNNMMNPMNNNGNMGIMNSQNNMMNQMNPMNNNGNMGMINNQFNQFNMMNPVNNNIMNSPMYQMCNQMNFVGNQMIPMLPMKNKSQDNIKFLSIRVKMEDGVSIIVQNTSNDKMEKAISGFCCKALLDKKDYDFFVITKHKAKFDSTVEENGISGNDDYILVKKKKIKNEKDKYYEIIGNNAQNKEEVIKVIKPIIKGNPINLRFVATTGLTVVIKVGLKNTFRDAAILFCNKVNIDPCCIKKEDIIFLRNAEKIDVNDYKTLEQIGIINGCSITVLDSKNIYGA